MINNKISILGLLLIIGLAYIVIAAAGDDVIIITPSSGTNITTASATIFNVSFNNGTDITDPQNATFFINISGLWSRIGSTSANGCLVSECAVNIINNTIPDGVYSVNATIYNASGSISVVSVSNLGNIVSFDRTPPQVFAENITSPSSNLNYSSTLILNVSAFDITTGISTLIFNITNSSGKQNDTISLSREGSTTRYSSTINTAHYPDGYYNLTVYARDLLENLNNSALVYGIVFDNTAPVITHSCDDYIVEEEDTIICTCSSSDSLTGVNTSYGSSGVSFTTNPSTTSTGTNFQTVCTSQDRVSNIKTSTLYYNVTGGNSTSANSGSSSGSSSSSSSSSNTNSSNSTTQNISTGVEGNTLQANQGNSATPEKSLKKNLWLIFGLFVVIALASISYIFIKKYKNKNF